MNLTIKNLPDSVSVVLKQAAVEHGRSLNSEVVQVLSQAATEAERRQRMRETRGELDAFVAGLKPVSRSAELIRADRRR